MHLKSRVLMPAKLLGCWQTFLLYWHSCTVLRYQLSGLKCK
jgi:hypothetical protein